jgi:hypothetical protein
VWPESHITMLWTLDVQSWREVDRVEAEVDHRAEPVSHDSGS